MEMIVNGLKLVHKEWEEEEFVIKPNDEDIHTGID